MTQAGPLPLPPSPHRAAADTNPAGRTVLAAWALSIVVHALVFLGMLALAFPLSARDAAELPVTRVELLGPVDRPSSGVIPVPQPPRAAIYPEQTPSRYVPKSAPTMSEPSLSKKPELTIIGIGAGGGDFERYGFQVGGGAAPQFFGLGGSARGARKIVYVVDISGSMVGTFGYVQAELKRSISALRRSQKFHVIFFNQDAMPSPPGELVSAIAARKHQFFEFLDGVTPHGDTKPASALRRALGMKPDLVYLLSDGQRFPPDLLRELDQWNRDRRVRICTIAYLDPTGSELLEAIAREHHGEFTFVSGDDLP